MTYASKLLLGVLLVSVGLASAACAGAPPKTGDAAGRTPPAASTGTPGALSVREVPAPAFTVRELRLPVGCTVTDHTDRLAIYRRVTGEAYPKETLGLLDLESGDSAEFLPAPVNARDAYFALDPRVSDRFVAWLEVSPNPGGTVKGRWRLYAAPLDAAARRIGPPALVDEADVTQLSRPRFALSGTTLVWATTRAQAPEGVPRTRLAFKDLTSGERTVAYSSVLEARSLTVSEDVALLTESTAEGAATVRAITLADARVSATYELRNEHAVSHAPALHDGRLAFGVLPNDEAIWAYLYVRDTKGIVSLLARDATDPVFAGRYLVYESTEPTGAVGSRTNAALVRALDIERGERFDLASTIVSRDGSWQTVEGAAYHASRLVLAKDGGLASTPARDAATLVRVYELSR